MHFSTLAMFISALTTSNIAFSIEPHNVTVSGAIETSPLLGPSDILAETNFTVATTLTENINDSNMNETAILPKTDLTDHERFGICWNQHQKLTTKITQARGEMAVAWVKASRGQLSEREVTDMEEAFGDVEREVAQHFKSCCGSFIPSKFCRKE